jgi:hypothetical protein
MPRRKPKQAKPPRSDKTDRQRDQRRVARDRQAQQDLRRRLDQPDTLQQRDDDGPYRP